MKIPRLTWPHVVAILVVTAGIFATAWQAPLALVVLALIAAFLYRERRSER